MIQATLSCSFKGIKNKGLAEGNIDVCFFFFFFLQAGFIAASFNLM